MHLLAFLKKSLLSGSVPRISRYCQQSSGPRLHLSGASSQQGDKKKALLPGFGRPLNYKPVNTAHDYVGELFKTALSTEDISNETRGVFQEILTLREMEMLHFMNNVTDKPEWFNKVNNEEITKKWKNEVCGNPKLDFTPKMADYSIDELRHMASTYSASPGNPPPIFVYNGDVVKSDTAVSPELKQALQEEIMRFESAIPEKLRDWHPGSDEKVLDLVHPSLFPLIYGKTRILHEGEITTLANCIERCGEGEVVPQPPDEETFESSTQKSKVFSQKFQWLPCEVDISGENAKIKTYINNLHPHKEKPLYKLIEKVIDASIPLWNATLAPLADESFFHEQRIAYCTSVEYDPDPESWPESEQIQQQPGEIDDDFWERQEEWIRETRRLVFPEPGDFKPPPQAAPFDLKSKYGQRGLQIIVKLANIHLTPEKPEYEGGTWHVEGQMNEHIVATALYYYSTENITTSTLSFRQLCERQMLEANVFYEQNDHEWLTDIFGCENLRGTVQNIGSVETREGRLLTFPNVLQHRVEPFKLADSTKPGHRKIIALFLVDPNLKITSTAHVPCQQQEWWRETTKATINGVPIEPQDGILEDVDFPVNLQEAKALRLELMEERKNFVAWHGDTFESSNTFALCEH